MKQLHILLIIFAFITAGTTAKAQRLSPSTEGTRGTLEQLYAASETNPVDATWLIVNPSFETGDETGWTLIGKDPDGNDEFQTTNR